MNNQTFVYIDPNNVNEGNVLDEQLKEEDDDDDDVL